MTTAVDREKLEGLYRKFNHREYVHPDPLEFLFNYPEIADREIVGLVASSLAFGRVSHILSSVSSVLTAMPPPSQFLRNTSRKQIEKSFRDFRHRWATGGELSSMLIGIKRVIERHGSLENCFLMHFNQDDKSVLPALVSFIGEIAGETGDGYSSLLSEPSRGSACKRHHLFLRWMVRADEVDPGGWKCVRRSMLVVPLDVHLHRICTGLGMTARRNADMKTAVEITNAFREINPDDPVKYDFCLTRLGIRDELDYSEILDQSGIIEKAGVCA